MRIDPQARPLDLLPDGVLILDAETRIVDCNRATERLTGYPREALLDRPCAEVLDPRSKQGSPLLDGAFDGSAFLPSVHSMPEQDVVLLRADGADAEVLVTGAYLRDEHGALNGAALVVRARGDRTHKQTSGIEIVSTVSHELRSPLTSVKGYVSLLLNRWDRIDDEQKKAMLEQVHHDSDRVRRLIDELLDISRLETGRLHLRRQMLDVHALATSVVDKVAMEYADLDATVTFADGFPEVYADPDKITQVLTNLVENACKYGSTEGLRVDGAYDDGAVAVSVTDTGEGIPDEDLPKVFTKFFRRDLGRPTGSGLGLWISRGLVEAHGGELTADSAVGRGTTFRFTLPLFAFEELHGSD